MKTEFKLTDDYIELIRLLKVTGICAMGSEAKRMVENGLVKRNGLVELRKRAKLCPGDIISVNNDIIHII